MRRLVGSATTSKAIRDPPAFLQLLPDELGLGEYPSTKEKIAVVREHSGHDVEVGSTSRISPGHCRAF
jgi:hypothetical protein